MALYIVEFDDPDFGIERYVETSLKEARRSARDEAGWDTTVRIFRVTGLHPVPISPIKEMNQSDVCSQSEPC